MGHEYLTTRELAALLRIKERKVYDLVSSRKVPYSKTTGKLLFPRVAIDQWLKESSFGVPSESHGSSPRPEVFLGSHDPLLDWALRESQCGMATIFDSSVDGLERFQRREGCVTGLHIYDSVDKSWNVGAVRQRFATDTVVLCHWASRARGLIVNEQYADRISGLNDIHGLRFAPRQSKAGSQQLFIALLEKCGMNQDAVSAIDPQRTEIDAALSVVEDRADFTFGLQSVASQYRLPFVPLVTEKFDLLVDRRAWFEPSLQTLFAFTLTDAFARRARELAGYDLSAHGSILFNA